MTLSFDLISDLHLDTWDTPFDLIGQATSPICVVAGDVTRDHQQLREFLKHLSKCYAAVFYLDGNDEHRYQLNDLDASYRNLARTLKRINRVTYLQNNLIIIDGVAIIGANGWWGFDLDENIDHSASQDWMRQVYEQRMPEVTIDTHAIQDYSRNDTAYLINTIQRIQTHNDVKKVVVVTHTVPNAELINHDLDLVNTHHFNCMGNRLMRLVLSNDTEHKIDTWCFGHYHRSVDRIIDNVRYVNNCRGRGDTEHRQHVYYPKRIGISV
jgi:UDP-2,3-diacylglucosamine pyrophosphatase LpxH